MSNLDQQGRCRDFGNSSPRSDDDSAANKLAGILSERVPEPSYQEDDGTSPDSSASAPSVRDLLADESENEGGKVNRCRV